jgi:hypothetical protein
MAPLLTETPHIPATYKAPAHITAERLRHGAALARQSIELHKKIIGTLQQMADALDAQAARKERPHAH